VRDAKDYFPDIPEIKVEKELLSLAEHILKAKEAHFYPSRFVDRCEETIAAMLKKKQQGLPATKAKVPRPDNVVNLFDRRSIAQEEKSAPKPTKAARPERPKKGRATFEGQRELLLPIAGKKTKTEKKPTRAQAPGRRKAG
jgi:DNA end-binding protein Ku